MSNRISFSTLTLRRQDEEKQQGKYKQRMLKTFRNLNWIGCDCCSNWYSVNCVKINLSDSRKIQCPMSVNVKSIKNYSIGNDSVLDRYVNTVIFVLKKPKRSGCFHATAMSSINHKKVRSQKCFTP